MPATCSQIKQEYEVLMKQAAGFVPIVADVAAKKADFSEAKKRLKELAAAYDGVLEKVDRYDLTLRRRVFAKLKKEGALSVGKFYEGMAEVTFAGNREAGEIFYYRYVNRAGKIVGEKYEETTPFSCGRAFVRSGGDHRYMIIDKSGSRIGNGSYLSATDFVDGLARVRRYSSLLVSLVDISGERVGDAYAEIGSFCDGLAKVRCAMSDEYKYINKNGQSNEKKFAQASDFFHGHAIVGDCRGCYFIDRDGEPIALQERYQRVSDPSDGMTRVVQNRMYYFLNENLEKIGGPYRFAGKFSCGVAWVNQSGGYYLIDRTGARVCDEQIYSRVTNFFVGYAMAEIDDGWIFVDKKGERVGKECLPVSLNFDSSGFAHLVVGDKFFYFHASGRRVGGKAFGTGLGFSEGRCFVNDSSRPADSDYAWYVIDEMGKRINNERHESIVTCDSFNNGVAKIKYENDEVVYIERNGKRIFEQ